jgi:hypothetical protein
LIVAIALSTGISLGFMAKRIMSVDGCLEKEEGRGRVELGGKS